VKPSGKKTDSEQAINHESVLQMKKRTVTQVLLATAAMLMTVWRAVAILKTVPKWRPRAAPAIPRAALVPHCKDWCKGHTDTWEDKCGFATLACAGCAKCRPLQLAAAQVMAVKQAPADVQLEHTQRFHAVAKSAIPVAASEAAVGPSAVHDIPAVTKSAIPVAAGEAAVGSSAVHDGGASAVDHLKSPPPDINVSVTESDQMSSSHSAPGSKQLSSKIPLWMRQYFQFHIEQRKRESEPKYLVVLCTRKMRCGGTADRLKPMPLYLLLANHSRRVLLIRWTKPCPLEKWLRPVDGGIDWRAPASVQHAIDSDSANCTEVMKGREAAVQEHELMSEDFSRRQIVCFKVQSSDGGFEFYSKLIRGSAFKPSEFKQLYIKSLLWGFYGDMFRSMFAPVPAIETSIQKTMKRLKLEPGKYVSAHLRHPGTNLRGTRAKTQKQWSSVDKEGGLKLLYSIPIHY
jgi:hypothetical protein